MHTISSENNIRSIKIVFDKAIKNWQYDKTNIKYDVSSWTDKVTILLIPQTKDNYSILIKKYSQNENYYFNDNFINDYQNTVKEDNSLDNKRKLLKEKITLQNISDRQDLLDYSHLPKEYRKPFAHQKMELEYAVRMPAFYSLDEMGLGKTRVAIERHLFLKNKFNPSKINKSFIICPVTLMYNWANEIKKWCPQGENKYHLITGNKKNKIDDINMLLSQNIQFYIINFEGIDSIKTELLNLIDDKTNIIIDEFIKVKNPYARRSKNLIDICNKTDYVMGLCGTPISQGSIDLFSPSLCIDKGKKFGFSYDRFVDFYYWKQGWNLVAKSGTYDKISKKLYLNSLRFTKAECLDIPDKLYTTIPIDLPPENQSVYDQMVTFCMAELDGKQATAPIILVQLLRLSQITSGFIKTPKNRIVEFKNQPKVEAVSDILDNNNGTSIIIWSRFVRDIKALAKLCIDKNISFGCLIGSDKDFNFETTDGNKTDKNSPLSQLIDLINPEKPINAESLKKAYHRKIFELHPDRNPINSEESLDTLKKINALYTSVNRFSNITLPKNMQSNSYNIPSNLIGTDSYSRQAIVDKFQAGQIQVIIGTASTGGLGINLTKAERVIYYANDYSLINRLQSEDRAHRAGQKNKVSYYDIIANNTIDIPILKVLRAKKNIADIITGDNLKDFMKGK